MVAVPSAVSRHADSVTAAQFLAQRVSSRAWKRVDRGNIAGSWRASLTELTKAISTIQETVAVAASEYGAFALAEQGVYRAPSAFVRPSAFAGVAPDGRSLQGLLYSPAVRSKHLIGQGLSVEEAILAAQLQLGMIVRTLVADTARQAASVDIATRTGIGYARVVVGETCPGCVILAGRFYRWNAGFKRHPSCFPAGVAVSGPELKGATRRWFEGELVTLTTASGQDLPVTGNHPILTSRGWVPANLIQEGDQVVRSTRPEGASALVVPNHDQVPSLIEDVWSAFAVGGFDRVPASPENFHGDGQGGEVHVVQADRTLWNGFNIPLGEPFGQGSLSRGLANTFSLDAQGAAVLLDLRSPAEPAGPIGGGGLEFTFGGGHLSGTHEARLAHAAPIYASLGEDAGYWPARDAILDAQRILAGSSEVLTDNLVSGKLDRPARWDAPASPFSMETREGYTSRGRDLLQRLSGQVELDRVVKARSTEFRGHVYSLASSEGWHVANSLIVSNCDCQHIPTSQTLAAESITDPYEHFNSLSEAEQDELWGTADAQAIRDGADIYQVYNSRRGMTKAGFFTTEGTTRRGQASAGLKRGQRRLTPEGVYRMYPKREDAIRALEEHGYLLPGGQRPGGSIRGANYEGFGQMGRGGTRRAASEAILQARETGIRDPSSRYTMTAAERRLHDAQRDWEMVLEGRNPWSAPGFGNQPDPTGSSRGSAAGSAWPLTPEIAAAVEKNYRRWLRTGGEVFIN